MRELQQKPNACFSCLQSTNQQSLQLQLNEITVKTESVQDGRALTQETRTWSGLNIVD